MAEFALSRSNLAMYFLRFCSLSDSSYSIAYKYHDVKLFTHEFVKLVDMQKRQEPLGPGAWGGEALAVPV